MKDIMKDINNTNRNFAEDDKDAFIKKVKAVRLIMGLGEEGIVPINDNMFVSSNYYDRLVVKKDLQFVEKVGISFLGSYNGKNRWQFNNSTRKEGYELDSNATQYLPTRINEGNYIKAMNILFTVIDVNKYGVNILLTKEKYHKNWSAVYVRIVPFSNLFAF